MFNIFVDEPLAGATGLRLHRSAAEQVLVSDGRGTCVIQACPGALALGLADAQHQTWVPAGIRCVSIEVARSMRWPRLG